MRLTGLALPRLLACAGALALVAACGSQLGGVQVPGGAIPVQRAQPPAAGQLGGPGNGPGTGDLIPRNGSLLKARYKITARALGIPACNGVVELKIKADLAPREGAARAAEEKGES